MMGTYEIVRVQMVNGFRALGPMLTPPCEHDEFVRMPHQSFYPGGPEITIYECATCRRTTARNPW